MIVNQRDRFSFFEKLQRPEWVKRRLLHMLYHYEESRVYFLSPAEALKLPDLQMMNKDNIDDLKRFVPTESWHSREKFVSTSLERLKRGDHCYTRCDDGILAHFGWMTERQRAVPELGLWFELPPNFATINDFYTHPAFRTRGYYAPCLFQAIRDAALIPGTENIQLGFNAANTVSRWWIERIGSSYDRSIFYKKIFWIEKRWSTAIDHPITRMLSDPQS